MEEGVEQATEPSKLAEPALMRALVESLRAVFDGVLLLGNGLQILFANTPAAKALGFDSANALVGRSLEEVARIAGIPSWASRVLEHAHGHLEEEVPVEQSGAEPRLLEIRFCRDISPGLHLMAVRDASDRRRRQRGQAAYAAVAEVLLESPTLSEALPKLLRALALPLGFSVAELFRIDSDPLRLRWEGGWQESSKLPSVTEACRQHVFGLGEGLPGKAWATSEPIWLEDLSCDSGLPCRAALGCAGLKSGLAFPVRAVGEIVGVLVFFSEERRVRDEGVLRLLCALDALVGQFLERIRLHEAEQAQQEERERIARRLRLLQNVTMELVSAITPDHVSRIVLRAGVTALQADSAVLFVLDSSQELVLAGSINYQFENHPKYQHFGIDAPGPIAEAVRRRSGIFVRTAEEFAERYPDRAADLTEARESWVVLPLVADGTALGAMGLSFIESHTFLEEERDLMTALARQCALALDRARLFDAERGAKEQAESDRKRLRSILMNAPIPVVVYEGPEHVVAMANPAWLEMISALGGETDVVGTPLREAFQEMRESAEHVARELDRVYQTGETVNFSEFALPIPRPDGSLETHYYAASGQPIRGDGGRVEAIVQMAVDITDQVEARRRQEAAYAEAEAEMRAKDEFLAVLSHELRTPLQSMLGWTQLLLSRPFEPQLTRKGIETLERNTKQQAKLIEQLLDVSRIVAGKVLLDRHPLGLEAVVDAAVESLRTEATQKGVELVSSRTEDFEVFGDADRLRQVLTNLLGNAIKFTPQGGRVTVSLEREGSQARLTVADTGRGIPPALLRFIFDPFRQADASSRRVHGGLGLGLSIVKHLVEQHGGTVGAESPGEGRGATFTVKLPLFVRQGRAVAPDLPVDRLTERPASLENLRVLVVDDDADAAEIVAMALRDAGAHVQIAFSVAEAVERLWEMRPNIVVSDIAMPGEDGYAMIQRVGEVDASLGTHTPAVALTAYASPADRARALSAGFQAHLAKPVPPAELVRTVARVAKPAKEKAPGT